jgi:glutaredoxin 3
MATIEIYTKPTCPYCHRAKALLDAKGAAFEETDVSRGGAGRDAMLARSNGGTTVPQIFINGEHIGGSDDLHALDRSGRLDTLLAA